MLDHGTYQRLHKLLEERARSAMDGGDFGLAGQYARAVGELQRWYDEGQPGDPPKEAGGLLGVDLAALARITTPQPEPAATPAPVAVAAEPPTPAPQQAPAGAPPVLAVAPDAAVAASQTSPAVPVFSSPAVPSGASADALFGLYKQAKEERRLGNVSNAETTLQIIVEQAKDPALRSQAKAELEQLRGERRRSVVNATNSARQVCAAQPGNVAAQRTAWQMVLQMEPDNQEAQEALRKLDAMATSVEFRKELEEYRKPLVSRDIREVDTARKRVEFLLEKVKVRAPELTQEAQTTLDELNKLRDEILRKSQGGTSSERAGNLENAIAVYRNAVIVEKLAWILDDQTGEYVETSVALARARSKFFDYQIERTNARYGDAMEDLDRGAPDTAVGKLEEAQALLDKVEERGEELRKKVTTLLEKARDQKKSKDLANELVVQAENSDDPVQARTLLVQARQAYAAYPDIANLISTRDGLILRKAVNEITGDLARATGELALHKFGEALKACEQALTRGQNLTVSSEEYRQAQDRVKEMQARISAKQAAYQALQAKLGKIRTALAEQPLPNTPLAARLLKELTPQEAQDAEAVDLSVRLTLLGEADDVWVEAQRAFHNLQQYETAAKLCQNLSKDPAYAVRADGLKHRAEARLYTELAMKAEERGQIDDIKGNDVEGKDAVVKEGSETCWRKVRALRGTLPADDQYLLDDAETALKEIADQRQQQRALDKEFAAVGQLRLEAKWPAWLSTLETLEKKAPATMKTLLIDEREAGVEEWRGSAYKAALEHRSAARWKEAFNVLDPLFKLGILADDDKQYHQARLSYHKNEAARWEQSESPEDLEHAVEHRQEALAAAPPPATAERHELTAAIRRRAIRLAQRKATNPGPLGAYKVLQEQISQYHSELTEDAEIRCYLVNYALEAHEFEGARTTAAGLQYLPNYRDQGRVWQQLVDAVSLFFSQGGKALEAWEEGVDAFGQLSRDAMATAVQQMRVSDLAQPGSGRKAAKGPTAPVRGDFPDPIINFADIMCDQMHSSLPPQGAALADEEVLHRIRVYGLILRLKPSDNRATYGIGTLAGRLDQIAADLAGQSTNLRQRGSGGAVAGLAAAEILERKLTALTKALELVGQGKSANAQKLTLEHGALAEHIQTLRKAAKGLGDLEAAWRKTVSETWEIAPLEDALEEAQKAGAGRELEPWADRLVQVKQILEELAVLVTKIEDCWKQQKYEEVTAVCNELEGQLSQARMTLREDALRAPAEKPEGFDAFKGKALRGITAIRTAAGEKGANQAEWLRWQRQFEGVQALVRAAEGEAADLMSKAPPHLSKARVKYEELIKHLTASVALLSKLPPAPLSSTPEKLYKKVSDPTLIPALQNEIKDTEQQVKDIDVRLKQIEKPLADLKAFADAKRDLSRPANRQLLQSLIDKARAIDGEHIRVEPYQKLLDKYKR